MPQAQPAWSATTTSKPRIWTKPAWPNWPTSAPPSPQNLKTYPLLRCKRLAKQRPVSPSAESVAIAQNRVAEKAHFVACAAKGGADAITVAPYAVIETAAQLAAVSADLFPGILKTARMGYDGKGQIRVKTPAELATAFAELGGVTCVLEKMLPLKAEYSVILARGRDGQVVHFPPQLNVHVDGILATTSVYEGNMPPSRRKTCHRCCNICSK